MIKVAISLLILGIAILAISIGFLILTEAQLDDLPQNPVNQLVIAEKHNLEQTEGVYQFGVLVGAVIIGMSVIAAVLMYWRNR